MDIIPMLLKELEKEVDTTRKFLALVPNDKLNWQPHQKSMSIQSLATHIAELPSWVSLAFNTDEINFEANAYKPVLANKRDELLELLEKNMEGGKQSLLMGKEKELEKPWTMLDGEQIYFTMSKGELIRTTLCQIVHHRAQLGVYFRLLNIPLPQSYGPTADLQAF